MQVAEYEIAWSTDSSMLVEITKLNKEIEFLACKFYLSLGKLSDDKDMAAFWLRMSEEERTHMDFWGSVVELAERGCIPQIFDDNDVVFSELMATKVKIYEMLGKVEELARNQNEALLTSFRLEFYNIHSVLIPLLRFVKPLLNRDCPYDNYEKHLSSFIEAHKVYNGKVTPEMELLGEVMLRLWSDNLRLSRQSNIDELTGIFNRRGFANAAIPLMHLAQRNIAPVAFMISDVDHFKQVNDMFGHDAGDKALKAVVNSMRSALRGSDIIARYGGEEFIILCSDVRDTGTIAIAERLRSAVEALRFRERKLTISIGAVEAVPPLGMNANEFISTLCTHADMLLLDAKSKGRNRVEFQMHSFL